MYWLIFNLFMRNITFFFLQI